MADAIKWRSKIILAKIETTYGTDSVPATADGVLASNVEIRPMEGSEESRDLIQAFLGGQEEFVKELHVVLTYSTELVGSGAAGTVPGWGPLARACGLAETISAGVSVTYTPVSASMESISHYFWIDETRHIITGCRGSAQIVVDAQGIPKINWTFTGLWTNPAQASQVAPTLTGFKDPIIATNTNTPTFTINSVDMVMRNFNFDFGNDVQQRFLVGKEEILIVDRAETITTQVEAVVLTTLDPFALAQAKTKVPVVLTHGTTAGEISTINAPSCQIGRPDYANEQGALEWPLTLKPIPVNGNDQFSLVLT